MNPASRTRDIALVALVPLFFSTNVVIGRAVTAEVAPWTLAFLRWSGALLILLPFAVPALRENRDALVAQGGLIATLAFLGMWICGGLVYTALETTTATNATLIYTSANVMILILEWLFRGRPIGPRELIGTALAFTGVAIVALGGKGFAGVSMNSGDLFIGIAALSWAIYSVLLKRPGLSALPGLPLFAAIMLMGALMLLPMMLWEAWRGPALPRSPAGWLAVAGVALIPSVGAFSGYQYGIRRFGPGAMAMISYLATPYGILLAVVLLGETLGLHHAAWR
ncbi:MAG: DMT family transporter [Pseudomonadota bacterium]|nr:DMT family transporter [Pseudomonadota bacterium]